MSFKKQPRGFATKALHAGRLSEEWTTRNVVPSIFMSTTYRQDGPGNFIQYEYSRTGNPTRHILEKTLAALDDAIYGTAFASGLGATAAVLNLLSAGDHIVVGDVVYGGVYRLITGECRRLGIKPTFVDATNVKLFEEAIQPNTKMVWIESPTNPNVKVIDIEALSRIIKKKGNIIFAVDNTFLTSYFQRPLELGADLVSYSLTKYMNGHTDVCMGAVTTSSEAIYQHLKLVQNDVGNVPSPFDCYQVIRGLKTLPLRMEQHQKNALAIAKYLEDHSFVEKVLHPGLPSHPHHKLALKQTYGYSGIFAFYLKGGFKHAETFLNTLKVFTLAPSLGGTESLAALPKLMTHEGMPEVELEKLSINDSLIRVSIGFEDIDDLIDDLKFALAAAENLDVK